jgi:hypothetical protein
MRASYCGISGFDHGPVRVTLVVNKVSLGQVFLQVPRFAPIPAYQRSVRVSICHGAFIRR